MTTQLAPTPVFRGTDAFGFPLFLGQLGTFVAGTNTPQVTYKDSGGIATNTNPVILNARGECNLWLDPAKSYKLVLSDALGNLIWTVDNVTIGNANPTYNIIPTVDNLFTLGSTSFSWANVYVGPSHAPILGASGIVGYYPRTAAEIALSVTPTDFSYPADPYVDPRRYGASTAASDNQAALQTALNVAYQAKGAVWVSGIYKTSPLSVTMTGSSTQPLRIIGSSVIGSGFQAVAGLTATALLTFTNGIPAGVPINSFLVMEDISIVSTAKVVGVHGLAIKGLAFWRLSGVRITTFDHGLDVLYGLTALCDQECEFVGNNIGVNIAVDGSLSLGTSGTPNMLQFENCHISLNTNRGISFNGGTALQIIGCDIEGNGTGGDNTTGGVFILGQTSPDLGEGSVILDRNWFEANQGWSFNVAAQTNGTVNRIVMRSNQFIAAASGQNVLISGGDSVLIEDQQSASVGDLYNITATKATLINCSVQAGFTLNVSYPVFINCASGGGNNSTFGIQTQATLTYTGVVGTVNNQVNIYQQGATITIIFTDVQGTSNSTSFTMTGLPAKYQPISTWFLPAIIEDNGVDSDQFVLLSSGSGTLQFTKGGSGAGFTAAGQKGVRRCKIEYRLDI